MSREERWSQIWYPALGKEGDYLEAGREAGVPMTAHKGQRERFLDVGPASREGWNSLAISCRRRGLQFAPFYASFLRTRP